MKLRAKICGLTNLADAQHAVSHGAWALGFNFYHDSPRAIKPAHGNAICSVLPDSVIKVGIFIQDTYTAICRTMSFVGLDYAQIYQDFSAPYSFKRQAILALQATDEKELPPLNILSSYAYLLLDAPRGIKGEYGGTGRLANWKLAEQLARDFNLILAGGLNADKVQDLRKRFQPFAVDVASGVEKSPGCKDPHLIKTFLEACSDE